MFITIFSSPEPSIYPLSVVVVVVVVGVGVNFSHFHSLLQNQWVNFNQTWHKATLGEGDSSSFNKDNYEIAKI